MPRGIYDKLASTGNPIGIRLQASQRDAIEDLWRRACLPDGDVKRLGLPGRCDKIWFSNTFCAGGGLARNGSDSIWDQVAQQAQRKA